MAPNISFKLALFAGLLALILGCANPDARRTPTPDLEATVDWRVATAIAAMPSPSAAPTPDLESMIEGRVAAAVAALPEPESAPTPNVYAMVESRVATVVAGIPTPTFPPTPDIDAMIATSLAATQAAVPTPTPVPTIDIREAVNRQLASRLASFPTATPTTAPTPTVAATPTPTLADLVNRVKPSVVKITRSGGGGSGVIFDVDEEYAYIVTNYHIIGTASSGISVIVNNSDYYDASWVGYNSILDLAVLRIPCVKCQMVPLGGTEDVHIGTDVVIFGYPVGSVTGETVVKRGVVSAIGPFRGFEGGDKIQTDVAINAGNSGGPMFSMSGEVIGINTYRTLNSSSQGQGFAIPADTVRAEIERLRRGSVTDELEFTISRAGAASRTFQMFAGSRLAFSITTNPRVDFRIVATGGKVVFHKENTLFVEGEITSDGTGIYRLRWTTKNPNTYIRLRFEYDPVPAPDPPLADA